MLLTLVIGSFALISMGFGQSVVHPDGSSTSFRSQKADGVFDFHYDVLRSSGAKNGRRETGDAHGNRVGSYTIVDNDGRTRTVEYRADKDGFKAVITTNEQGTDNQSPADVTLYSNSPHARARRSIVQPIPYFYNLY